MQYDLGHEISKGHSIPASPPALTPPQHSTVKFTPRSLRPFLTGIPGNSPDVATTSGFPGIPAGIVAKNLGLMMSVDSFSLRRFHDPNRTAVHNVIKGVAMSRICDEISWDKAAAELQRKKMHLQVYFNHWTIVPYQILGNDNTCFYMLFYLYYIIFSVQNIKNASNCTVSSTGWRILSHGSTNIQEKKIY